MPFLESLLSFEAELRHQERRQAAAIQKEQARIKAALLAERAKKKAAEQAEKTHRRWKREAKAREKNRNQDMAAVCGINYYPMNSGWTHCHTCQQPLVFRPFHLSSLNPQTCLGRNRKASA